MNKTLKKTLSIIITILMLVTTVPFALAADASLVINMIDGYGDGWNGNAIQVGTISGGEFTKIADATFNNSKTATYETVISDESAYAFRWTKGSYPDECSFSIVIGGETVFETSDCSSYADNDYIYIWCNHSFSDSICSVCGLECGVDFAHTAGSDGKCVVCGHTLCDDHSYTNHYCKACGYAENGYYAGACGAENVNDVIWYLDVEGTLTISGTGKYEVEYYNDPWLAYKDSIKNVVIEEGITNIAVGSFAYLTNAVSLSIPSTMNEIDNYGNNNFAEFKLAEGNSSFTLVDGVLFNADKTELLMYPAKKAEETYTVPAGVTTLCEYSFERAKNLKTINISDDVTSIGSGCFGYSSLETITFGANVDSIERSAFSSTRLKTVVLPEKLTEIPHALFYVCQDLENLVIGSNVTSIDEDVINNCDKLDAVHFTGTEAQWEAITKPDDTTDAINTIAVHCGTLEEKTGFSATCGTDGHTAGLYCAECDDYISGEVIPATGEHPSYENGICTVCFYECEHDTDNGDCSICGKYVYAIAHQPTAAEPYVELNDDTDASYQWYKVEEKITDITDENASTVSFDWGESSYDKETGWTGVPFEEGYYGQDFFTVALEAGETVAIEVTGDFTDGLGLWDYDTQNDAWVDAEEGVTSYELTVEKDGNYTFYTYVNSGVVTVKVTVTKTTYTAIEGQTAAALIPTELGKYACEVTFTDGTKEMSDKFEVTHICDFSGEWKADSEKHWKECSCGDIAEESTHSWDFGKCTVCEYACKHSFTKYAETEAPRCGVAGKEVAGCNNGCGAMNEREITALEHKDDNGDYKCDNGCGHEFEKPAEPDTPDEPTDGDCDHLCHKSGFMGFIWKIIRFFQKIFRIQQYCDCGVTHW